MDKRIADKAFTGLKNIMAFIDRSLDEADQIILAIDGNSGAGKSYLASLLAGHYDCNLFHMDDFFLQSHQRTPDRLQEPGGNIDYERFQNEVIENLKRRATFRYQQYDCSQAVLTKWIQTTPKKLNIIEGVYSMHPLWNEALDRKIFLSLQPEEQLERIRRRSGEEMLERFLKEWIPLENRYFRTFRIAEQSDLVIETDSQPYAL
jgi:uridine kinase